MTTSIPSLKSAKVAVIGLGYVGLPLAAEFAKKRAVIGFDIREERVAEIARGDDQTGELSREEMAAASGLKPTVSVEDLRGCNVYIVTVPTPIDAHKRPDLRPLFAASKTVGSVLKPGDVVIYESTVYPGCTEEDCVPVLEGESGLQFNVDFYCGYSPERINPGDREHRVADIKKVTSGSTPSVAAFVDELYSSVITAGTHLASTIKVAEAAKVIENTQRDLNIALINELAMLFSRMGIDTEDVLQAAGTKWNFLSFRPGLVGGHCIGVDPYYLTHKAQALGCHPEVILSGRRINDGMGRHVASELLKAMLSRGIHVNASRVLVMGLTFKENCPDLRNTRVVDIVHELQEFHIKVDVYDPWVNPAESEHEYGISPVVKPENGAYDAIVVAVGHRQFKAMGAKDIRGFGKAEYILYDLKYILPKEEVDLRL